MKALLATAIVLLCASLVQADQTIPFPVNATFLPTDATDNVLLGTAVSLASLGVGPGDTIRVSSTGFFYACINSTCPRTNQPVVAAVTAGGAPSSANNLPTGLPLHVPGPSWEDHIDRTMDNLFLITATPEVFTIPETATTLWVAVSDSYFRDNVGNQSLIVETAPTITGPDTLWWFGGQSPSGYDLSLTLSSSAGSITTWSIEAGTDKVNLSTLQGAQTIVTTNGLNFSEALKDITVRATKNGLSRDFTLTSLKPNSLQAGAVTHNCDATWGYDMLVNYTILDQLGTPLPQGISLNERWTTGIVNDYAGTNWRRGAAAGATVSSAMFADHIQGELSNRKPKPVCDANSTVAVEHWGQAWHVGSTTIGAGPMVQTNVLQKNLGRAFHSSIVTPP